MLILSIMTEGLCTIPNPATMANTAATAKNLRMIEAFSGC
jgi:hypothetical protein